MLFFWKGKNVPQFARSEVKMPNVAKLTLNPFLENWKILEGKHGGKGRKKRMEEGEERGRWMKGDS